jgi:hypothetical protein
MATAPTAQPTSAADLLTNTLKEWGLSTLLPYVKDYLNKGYDSTTVNLYLQDTPQWKQRFAGNEIRKEKGLPVLSPAEYIGAEEQYSNVLKSYGLPKGFYDNHTDFVNFIGNDVSPTEVSERAKVAHDQYVAAPPEQKALWNQYYGPGDAIAGILDPNVATQVIKDRAAAVGIGGAAATQGIAVSGARAASLAQHQVTLAQAQNAYQQVAQYGQTDQAIGQRFGVQPDGTAAYGSTTEEENRLLLGNGAEAAKATVANASERGLFTGHPGATQQSIGVSQELSATDF